LLVQQGIPHVRGDVERARVDADDIIHLLF
jgi:hypothetical protein